MRLIFSAEQLLNNHYSNWSLTFSKLLSNPDCFIYSSSNSNDRSVESIIAEVSQIYGLTKAPNLLSLDETGDLGDFALFELESETTSDFLKSKAKKTIGFIGFDDDINKKLADSSKREYSLIISEMLPDELPFELLDANLNLFLASFYFLPPYNARIRLRRDSSAPVVLLHDSTEPEPKELDDRVLGIINKLETFRVIDFSSLNSNSEISFSSVYSLVANPQTNHALRQASPVPIRFIKSSNRAGSPVRELYFEEFSLNKENLLEKEIPSIRETITSMINSSQEDRSGINDQRLSEEAEIDILLNQINGKQTELRPFALCRPEESSFSLAQTTAGSESNLPAWLKHPGTESSLHYYLSHCNSSSPEITTSRNSDFDQFADFALRLIHLTDSEGKHLKHFEALYGETSDDNLEAFDSIIKQTILTYGTKHLEFTEMHAMFVAKHNRLHYSELWEHGENRLTPEKTNQLLAFLDEGKKFYTKSISPEMIRVTLLCIGGSYQDAITHCKNQEDASTKNILSTTIALAAALSDRTEDCVSSLEAYSPVVSQYILDYVNVAYLIARLFTPALKDDQQQKIISQFKRRKPDPLIWLTELHAMALLKAYPSDDSHSVVTQSEVFLRHAGSISAGSINTLLETPPNLPNEKLLHEIFDAIGS